MCVCMYLSRSLSSLYHHCYLSKWLTEVRQHLRAQKCKGFFFSPCQSVSSPSFYPSTTSRADCRNFQFLKARSMQFESYSSSQLLSSLCPSLGSGALAERRERGGDTPLNRPPASAALSPLWVLCLRLPLLAH